MTAKATHQPQVVPALRGERVILRGPRAEDVPSLCKYAGDPEVSRWMPNLAFPFGEAEAREVVRNAAERARTGEGYCFGIVPVEAGELIGIIGVKHICWPDRRADMGFWIGRGFRRKGFTEEAVRLALGFAFGTLRLHRVTALALAPNAASAGLLQKVGFRKEGVWRKDCFLRGRWYDAVVFGLLEGEYNVGR